MKSTRYELRSKGENYVYFNPRYWSKWDGKYTLKDAREHKKEITDNSCSAYNEDSIIIVKVVTTETIVK